MKIEELLFEGPYLLDQDAPKWVSQTFMSIQSLKREYYHLGTLTREDFQADFNFWLQKDEKHAVVTILSKNDIGLEKHKVVVDLTFHHHSPNVSVEKELHVSRVQTDSIESNKGLASGLYIVLARYGYSIISDFTQYNGGKALWKKLAQESEARNYVVRIWDDNEMKWRTDFNGEPVKYNAENLDDDEIWKNIELYNERTTLLVLQHR